MKFTLDTMRKDCDEKNDMLEIQRVQECAYMSQLEELKSTLDAMRKDCDEKHDMLERQSVQECVYVSQLEELQRDVDRHVGEKEHLQNEECRYELELSE